MIIKDQNFVQPGDAVEHGFFTRQGGVSEGIFASLNCGPVSNDNLDLVHENRRRVATEIGVEAQNLLSVYQVHGATCLSVDTPFAQRPDADGLVTDKPGLGLGVLTADCAPVLLCGKKENGAPVIGAAHAGWGGAFKGILQSTVQAMQDKGAVIDSIRAAVGPCIGPSSYEVSDDFKDPFLEQDEANAHFFKSARREGHLMFDLPGYVAKRLSEAGLTHVSITGLDTFADEERFFSYRRTTHRGEEQYGRQISCIAIKG